MRFPARSVVLFAFCFGVPVACLGQIPSPPFAESPVGDCSCQSNGVHDPILEKLSSCSGIKGSPQPRLVTAQIFVDKLNRAGTPSGLRNSYSGPVDLSNPRTFKPTSKHRTWRTILFFWQFDLRGFLEMGALQRIFDLSGHLRIKYDSTQPCDDGICSAYSMTPEDFSGKPGDYTFQGTVEVAAQDCQIIEVRGAYLPDRKVSPLGEDFWFPFVTRFRKDSEGHNVPSFTCVSQRKAKFPIPAFRTLVVYRYPGIEDPSVQAEQSCQ